MRYAMILAVLALVGCEGPMGPPGPQGEQGPAGEPSTAYIFTGQMSEDNIVTVDLPAGAGSAAKLPAATCYYSPTPNGPDWRTSNRECSVIIRENGGLSVRMHVYSSTVSGFYYYIVVHPS